MKIWLCFIITWKYIFIWKWVRSFFITCCAPNCRIFRKGLLLHSHQNLNFKIPLFVENWCGIIIFWWYFVVTVMHYLLKSFFLMCSHFKLVLRFFSSSIFLLWKLPFLKILLFWVQNEIQNVLTHFQMKMYFPVMMKFNEIFMLDHTYLLISTFTFIP